MAVSNAVARSRRLGLRKVNQDPRPPNEPRHRVDRARRARDNRNKKPQSQPQINTAGPVDPRDDQYWRDYTQLNFNKDLNLSQLNTEDVYANTAYQAALQRRSFDEPLEVQRMREQANVGGTIYSTAHQENLGLLGQEQFQTRSDLENAYNQALADRALQRQGIQGQYNLDTQNAFAAGAARASQEELQRPAPYLPPPTFPAPHEQNKGYNLPHQKDLQRITAARQALRKRVGLLQTKRGRSDSSAQREALARRIRSINKKRQYLSKF
jgi:hypothetical protein